MDLLVFGPVYFQMLLKVRSQLLQDNFGSLLKFAYDLSFDLCRGLSLLEDRLILLEAVHDTLLELTYVFHQSEFIFQLLGLELKQILLSFVFFMMLQKFIEF